MAKELQVKNQGLYITWYTFVYMTTFCIYFLYIFLYIFFPIICPQANFPIIYDYPLFSVTWV